MLDEKSDQTLGWAVNGGMIDLDAFHQAPLVARYEEAEVWETSRRR